MHEIPHDIPHDLKILENQEIPAQIETPWNDSPVPRPLPK